MARFRNANLQKVTIFVFIIKTCFTQLSRSCSLGKDRKEVNVNSFFSLYKLCIAVKGTRRKGGVPWRNMVTLNNRNWKYLGDEGEMRGVSNFPPCNQLRSTVGFRSKN
jgi:hypothetical protein